MKSFGHFLICEDAPFKTDAMVVLSGGAYDRGNEAARLFKQGFSKKIICPGGNLERAFLVLKDSIYESDLTLKNICRNGIDTSLLMAIHAGTSTAEEADTLFSICKNQNLKSLLVVSSKFHTRRVQQVYKKRFEKAGIKICVRGAPAFFYDEENWWKSENGLLNLNNEYVKQLYYLIK